VLEHYKLKHKLVTPDHPQTNGQTEVSKSELKMILEKIVTSSRRDSSLKIDEIVCAYKSASKTSIGPTLFQLVHVKAFTY